MSTLWGVVFLENLLVRDKTKKGLILTLSSALMGPRLKRGLHVDEPFTEPRCVQRVD